MNDFEWYMWSSDDVTRLYEHIMGSRPDFEESIAGAVWENNWPVGAGRCFGAFFGLPQEWLGEDVSSLNTMFRNPLFLIMPEPHLIPIVRRLNERFIKLLADHPEAIKILTAPEMRSTTARFADPMTTPKRRRQPIRRCKKFDQKKQ